MLYMIPSHRRQQPINPKTWTTHTHTHVIVLTGRSTWSRWALTASIGLLPPRYVMQSASRRCAGFLIVGTPSLSVWIQPPPTLQGEAIYHCLLLLEAPVLFFLIPANPRHPPHACHSHHPALITCALMCLLWGPEFVKTIFTNTAQPLLDFLIMIFAIRPLEIFGLNKNRPKPSLKRAKQTCLVRNGDISPQVSSVQQQLRGFYRFFFS